MLENMQNNKCTNYKTNFLTNKPTISVYFEKSMFNNRNQIKIHCTHYPTTSKLKDTWMMK